MFNLFVLKLDQKLRQYSQVSLTEDVAENGYYIFPPTCTFVSNTFLFDSSGICKIHFRNNMMKNQAFYYYY